MAHRSDKQSCSLPWSDHRNADRRQATQAGGYGSLRSQGRHRCNGKSRDNITGCGHSRNIRRRRKLPVVPANAGTHHHRKQFVARQSGKQSCSLPWSDHRNADRRQATQAGGYGSLRSQGRHRCNGKSRDNITGCGHSRNIRRRRKLPVVPANAGTHHHSKRFVARRSDKQSCSLPWSDHRNADRRQATQAGGYGSLRSQGRHRCNGKSRDNITGCGHSRNIRRRRKLPVVPANAGTHNHRERFVARQSDQQIA
ncbi:phage protein U [Bradyrhizobium sp. USDA 4011]